MAVWSAGLAHTAERWRLEGAQVLGGRAGALPVPAGKRLKYPL